jgi:PAS domain S-box-containing protein
MDEQTNVKDYSIDSSHSVDYWLNIIVKVCASLTIFIGLVVLIEWSFNIWDINKPSDNFIPMAEETAILFIITGVSLFLITKNTNGKILKFWLIFSSLLIAGIASLALIDFGNDYKWDLSDFIGNSNVADDGYVIGQMSGLTAICFLLISISFLMLKSKAKKYSVLPSSLALIIGYIIVMGYTYGVPILYGGTTIPMALSTAFSFMFSAIGLILALGKENAPIKYFLGDSNQAYLLRNLLPIIFILMFVHDIVGADFEANFNSTNALTSSIVDIVFLIISATIISLLSFSIGNSIDKNIKIRRQSEKNLADERQRLAVIIEGTNSGTWEWNIQTGETIFNEQWATMIGYTLNELYPTSIKTWERFVHPEDFKLATKLLERHFSGELEFYECELRMKHKNGNWIWIIDRGKVSEWAEDGTALKMSGTQQDITQKKLAEEELNKTKEYLELSIDAASIGTWAHDITLDPDISKSISVRNLKHDEIFGYTEKVTEWGVEQFFEHIVEEDKPLVNQAFELLRKTEKLVFECRILWADQSIHWISVKGKIFKDFSGNPIQVAGTIIDITQEKLAEIKLREMDEQFRIVFKKNPISMLLTVPFSGDIIDVNEKFESLMGYAKEEVIGKTANEIGLFFDSDDVFKIRQLLHNDSKIDNLECKFRAKAGGYYVGLMSVNLIMYNGELCQLNSVFDITERKNTELKLKESQHKLEQAEILGNFGSWVYKVDEGLFYSSPGCRLIYGLDKEIVLFEEIKSIRVIDYYIMMDEAMKGLIEENKPYCIESKIKRKSDGKIVDLLIKAEYNPLINSVYGTTQDITKQKQLENNLKKSLVEADRFRTALDKVSSYTFIKNKKFQYTYANEKTLEMFHCSLNELEGKTDYDFFAEAAANQIRETDKYVLAGNNSTKEINLQEINGDIKTYIEIKTPIYEIDGKTISGIMGISHDITERKAEEERIEENNLRLELAMNTADMAWWEMDIETGLVKFDKKKTQMLGYAQDDFKFYTDFTKLLHPDDYEKTINAMRKHYSGEVSKYEVEYRLKTNEGVYKWFYDIGTIAKKDTEGKPITIAGLVIDISARKEAEDKLREKDNEFKKLSSNVPDLIFQFTRKPDGTYFVPVASAGIMNIFGCRPEDVLNDFGPIARVIYPQDAERVLKDIEYSAQHLSPFTCEFRVQIPNKDIQWIYSRSTPEKLVDGSVTWYGFNTDITELKRVSENESKLNRIYSFISKINELILYSTDEINLYKEACDIAIKYGEFKMAWVGVLNIETKGIVPIVHAGFEDNYLSEVKIVADQNLAEGKGPSGRAIIEGTYVVSNDIENDPIMLPWKTQAMARGYRSSIALPIKKAKKVVGIYTLYAHTPNFFNEEEIKLLNEVADNISFAAENIEKEILRKRNAEKMAKDQEQIRTLSLAIEQSPITVVITDLDGNIVFVNPKFTEVTGYKAEDAIGQNPRILNSGYTKLPEYEKLWNTIKSGKNWHGTFLNKKKNGELFWESAVISPVKDTEGRIINYLAVKEDITEMKLIEEEKGMLLSDLIQHNKNLEQYAYIVSHNLRTPVANIIGLSNLLKMESIDEKQKELYSSNLLNSVEKLDEVIKDLNTILQVKNQINNKAETILFKDIVTATIDSIKTAY